MIIRPQNLFKFKTHLASIRHRSSTALSNEFDEIFHTNRVEISAFQRTLLTCGSALVSILDPTRADMIACFGETSGECAASQMHARMSESPEGAEIITARPRINSRTVDLSQLRKMPEGTLGKCYINFLDYNNVTPDSRLDVRFVRDIDNAYVLQRYREVHDIFHTILGMPTHMLGEVTVKWAEAFQTKLPMCISAAIFGPLRLKPKHRKIYREVCLPWAIKTGIEANFLMNVYFEKRWEQPLDELLKELNITPLDFERIKIKKDK